MEPLLENQHFLERCFLPEELDYVRSKGKTAAQTLAGLFAAKEACCKALGTGIAFPLTDIRIDHTPEGMPFYRLTGQPERLLEGRSITLSITHEAGMAAAVCLIL